MGEVQLEGYDKGIIICKGCKNYQAFMLQGKGDQRVTFKAMSTDAQGIVVYYPLLSTGSMGKDKLELTAIVCCGCNKKLPTWLLQHNTYLTALFKQQENKPNVNPTS